MTCRDVSSSFRPSMSMLPPNPTSCTLCSPLPPAAAPVFTWFGGFVLRRPAPAPTDSQPANLSYLHQVRELQHTVDKLRKEKDFLLMGRGQRTCSRGGGALRFAVQYA